MNPKHYPSLELCKKLTEAGFPETEKYIQSLPNGSINGIFDTQSCSLCDDIDFTEYWCPSIPELLDETPLTITYGDGDDYHLAVEPFYKEVCYRKWYKGDATEIQVIMERNMANALAEMWLWLVENKYITPNQK